MTLTVLFFILFFSPFYEGTHSYLLIIFPLVLYSVLIELFVFNILFLEQF